MNAIVHQSSMPSYEMVFAPPENRCIQLSYHDGEHYNSIRMASDKMPGQPARGLTLQQLNRSTAYAKNIDEDGEGNEAVQAVLQLLPDGHGVPTSRAAAEKLLQQELGIKTADSLTEPDGALDNAASCSADSNKEPAAEEPARSSPSTSGRPSRAEKRNERRRAKDVASARRKATAQAEAADEHPEQVLANLAKQLVAV